VIVVVPGIGTSNPERKVSLMSELVAGAESLDPPREYEDSEYIGTAAVLLAETGRSEAALLLTEVTEFWFSNYRPALDETGRMVYLEVPSRVVPAFTDDRCAEIADAFCTVMGPRQNEYPDLVQAVPQLVSESWKDHLKRTALEGPKNQARIAPVKKEYPCRDGMVFRNDAEVRVYEALKAKQEALPRDDTFTIVPNGSVRVPGRTWEPDFLLAYKGRCCALEVDGGSHTRKYVSDKSRDQLMEEAGIGFVRRVDRGDAMNQRELYELIERVLRKLSP
jgi:hypothetical protein